MISSYYAINSALIFAVVGARRSYDAAKAMVSADWASLGPNSPILVRSSNFHRSSPCHASVFF